jgi:G-patch domain
MTHTASPATSTNVESSSSSGLKFSFVKRTVPTKPSKLANGVTAFYAHDSDEEEPTIQAVTHLEDGQVVGQTTAVTVTEKQPLVIKPPETAREHWLQRRMKLFRPDMVDNKPPENVDLSTIPDRIGDGPVKVGLQLAQKKPLQITESEEFPEEMPVDEPPKSDEELARELLLAQATDPTVQPPQPQIIITPRLEPLSESEVYAHDIAQLSGAPTLETYKRVPVEAFGMGILLGLGWKQGTDLQGNTISSVKEPKKRPDFLGIGAKEEAFLRVDEKGRKVSRKDGLGGQWNPLKKIDRRTGEVVPESRVATPKEQDRSSGRSSPAWRGSGYVTPEGTSSDRDRRKSYDRRLDLDRRYDSDRERRRENDDRKRDREYDSDYDRRRKDGGRREYERRRETDDDRKRRKEGSTTSSSRRDSRRASPDRRRSVSPRKG